MKREKSHLFSTQIFPSGIIAGKSSTWLTPTPLPPYPTPTPWDSWLWVSGTISRDIWLTLTLYTSQWWPLLPILSAGIGESFTFVPWKALNLPPGASSYKGKQRYWLCVNYGALTCKQHLPQSILCACCKGYFPSATYSPTAVFAFNTCRWRSRALRIPLTHPPILSSATQWPVHVLTNTIMTR